MGRFWSLLFLMVPILGVGLFVLSIAGTELPGLSLRDHWLPENINDGGYIIDDLFNFIMYLTGAIFIATGIALFWFLWKYDAAKNSNPVKFVHGSHTFEVVWTLLPAATLLFIAIFQMDAWANHKMRRPILGPGPDGIEYTADDELKPAMVEVTGRQFEWRIRYAGADGKFDTPDDLHTVNDLHVPVDEDIVIAIKSQDVLHSFFLPNLRLKQDVVPGMKQFVWFHANRTGTFDIVCAELCGWGHYKMRGQISVESREKFDAWFQDEFKEQGRTQLEPSEDEE